MRKRIVAGSLVLIMVLSMILSACSQATQSCSETTTDVQNPSNATADATVEAPSTSSAENGYSTVGTTTEPTIESTVAPTTAPTEPHVTTEPEEEKDEFGLTEQQRNSYSMLYFLAITAEEIRISKDNRLVLEDIYTSLFNDINPGAIDETTQNHLENLRNVIEDYLDISTKRERLQYLYNQEKAASIRSAVPDPLAILSIVNALDWRKMATSVVFTVVDSYNNYKNSSEAADLEYLMNGWELDDEATEAMRKNRRRAFNYMVDIVQEYGLDGKLTLSETSIETFAEICGIEALEEKIRRLETEEETYQLLGNYWLELANCYFETKQYQKCLSCVETYNKLSTSIYRKDYNYVQILPKAIVALRYVEQGEPYVTRAIAFADDIIENTETKEWAVRYFAAQTYLDLYAKTNNRDYLESAYNIAYDNVTVLLDEQRNLNATFLAEVKEVTIEEPDYRYLTEAQKKEREKEHNEELKRLKAYNKEMIKARETELPPLYEPLVLNCDLLIALAEEMNISYADKTKIKAILQTDNNGIFLSDAVNDRYSFATSSTHYTIELDCDHIVIPANLLTEGAKVVVKVTTEGKTTTFDDCVITKVDRKGQTVDTFYGTYTSKTMKGYNWSASATVQLQIFNGESYEPITFNYRVVEYKDNWLIPDKVVFEQI
ncbi:MAG: hypothetical protein IKB80_00165 [Oscillospiraceae bacterium]|nr:hypothetical protein [Oscillospiraceae bacterium]